MPNPLSQPTPPPAVPADTATGTAAQNPANTLKAIGLILLALICFTMLDTTAKYVQTERGIPAEQTIWVRFLGQFLLVMALVPALGIMPLKRLFQTTQFWPQMVRSVLMAVTTACNFLALSFLPLHQTVTIFFLAPLLVSLIAGPLLGEWVGWRRMTAIIIGFLGIVIVMRPGVEDIDPAIGFSFAAMAAYALFILSTRRVADGDPPLVTLHYSLIVGTIAIAPIAIVGWVPPADASTWGLLLALGVLGGTGHYFFIVAHRLARASTLAPFIYLQIISMITMGYVVFDVVPDVWSIVGAGIVVASGVYLFNRERVVKQSQPD